MVLMSVHHMVQLSSGPVALQARFGSGLMTPEPAAPRTPEPLEGTPMPPTPDFGLKPPGPLLTRPLVPPIRKEAHAGGDERLASHQLKA